MRLYEFEGIELFRREGIPVPDYAVVTSPREARQRAAELGLPVVIKAQVLAGGRGLAGGIKSADSLEQVEKVARYILGSQLKGFTVERLVVARKVEVARELYLGVTVDGYKGVPVIILSPAGGVSIEEVARTSPELVVSRQVTITAGLGQSEASRMVKEAGLTGEESRQIGDILHALYTVFRKYDALITEINPLALIPLGGCLALDAKVEIDDSSLYRHPEFMTALEERISNPLERKGRQIGVTYVEMDGDIGLISSGAGLGMATMDIIGQRFRPANFLETGGAITAELLYQSMNLVMQKKGLKAVFINLYGGINPIHEGARGIVQYIQEHRLTIPIVAKALGNRQEETWEILKGGGVNVVTDVATEKGVDLLAHLLEGSK
jgi:succinyl-CoA synthetase beta subunit